MTRSETCKCDFAGCAEVANVDHQCEFPRNWTKLFDLATQREVHLCPEHQKALWSFIEGKLRHETTSKR